MAYDLMGEEDVMGDDEMETVGAPFRMVRGAAPRGSTLRLPPRPAWRQQIAPGVPPPSEGLETLPMVPSAANGIFTNGGVTSIFWEARPQRPFRGERIIAIVSRSAGAGGIIPVINPGIFVGTNLQAAELGQVPLETFAPTAFGVRLTLTQAAPGLLIKIPVELIGNVPVGEQVAVSITILGRSVR